MMGTAPSRRSTTTPIRFATIPTLNEREQLMAVNESIDAVLSAFDDHLARTRGTNEMVRLTYCRYARMFQQSVSVDGVVDPSAIEPA